MNWKQTMLQYKLKTLNQGQQLHQIIGSIRKILGKPQSPVPIGIPNHIPNATITRVIQTRTISVEFIGTSRRRCPRNGNRNPSRESGLVGRGGRRGFEVGITIFLSQKLGPKKGRGGVESPSKDAKKGIIFYIGCLDPQTTLMLKESDSVPINQVHPLFSLSSYPDKVSLGSIKELMKFAREKDKLNDMVGNTAQSSFSQGESPSHIEESSFPTRKFGMQVIKEKMKVGKFRRPLKYGEAQVLRKRSTSLDTKNRRQSRLGSWTAISRKDNLRLTEVDLLARVRTKAIKDPGDGETRGSICLSKQGPHLREEASLSRTNDGLEVRLNSIGSNLTNNFILTIAKDNRSEVSKRRGILTLRNQAQISRIHLSIHGIGGEGKRSREKGGIEGEDSILDLLLIVYPDTILIEGLNTIFPPLVNGSGMKEFGVLISLYKSVNSRFKNLEIRFIPEKGLVVLKKLLLKGKNCFMWVGPKPMVLVWDPEVIRDVFNKHALYQKPKSTPLTKLLAQGIGSYEEDKWAMHRKILNPAFHTEKIKNMFSAVHLSCSEMVSQWEEAVSMEGTSCEVDIWPYLQRLTSDVISRTAFGSNYEEGRKIFELQKEQAEHVVEATRTLYITGWRYPDCQVRAREEVLQVFGDGTLEFDGLNRLKTVTMILHESLRLYPPIGALNRKIKTNTKLGELSLPAGVMLSLPILLLHHDKEIWGDDAMEFKPERFSDGVSKATKGQMTFFPFGGGPRICIGLNFAMIEAKMALAMILQRFTFELSPSYTHAPLAAITMQPQYGAPLVLHKRL
ncbi:11-oxo-beta-amyrin 30-oxidase [Capsicum annuum]|nr:11-oxo-beta-amyrin 30-oxidase [Capsicum annuum]